MIIKSERHRNLLDKTLLLIKESMLSPYIRDIILYGSCARQEEKWKSDIDLFVEFEQDILNDEFLYNEFRQLCSRIRPSKLSEPDIDIHFTCSEEWKTSNNIYHKQIRKDGISIWK